MSDKKVMQCRICGEIFDNTEPHLVTTDNVIADEGGSVLTETSYICENCKSDITELIRESEDE